MKCDYNEKHILHDIIEISVKSLYNLLSTIINTIINYSCTYYRDNYYTYYRDNYYNSIKKQKYNYHINNTYFFDLLFKLSLNPILSLRYPIIDIKLKYDVIINAFYSKKYINKSIYSTHLNNSYNYYIDNDLTQNVWNEYMLHIQNINRNTKDDDIFDTLISQHIKNINFDMTIAIKTSKHYNSSKLHNTNEQYIQFGKFYHIIKKIFGDAADIKYRYTHNNIFFSGILHDKSPYKKFAIYDIINF